MKDVTIIGISLGGYLAPRAAAFDKITQDMQDKCEDIVERQIDIFRGNESAKR